MSPPRSLVLLPAFAFLVATSFFHLLVAPYTKVEESFTLHAVWDVLSHGQNISKYDHWEFPGAVKRSFIPSLLLSTVTYPLTYFQNVNLQFLIRLSLLCISLLHMHVFANKVSKVYGVTTANFFLLFTATQFHIPFYLSRTLPNFLALPIVVVALSQLLATDVPATSKSPTWRLRLGTGLLLATGIIARSEIAMLCGTVIFVDLVLSPSPKRYFFIILPALIVSGIISTAATVTVDTYLWNAPSFPELEGLLFNVVGGHASEWGVESWYYYLLSIPKLLLNPISTILIVPTIVITRYTSLSTIDTIRKLRYILFVPIIYILGFSILSHKEWRFIIYIIPLLTITSSISASYIHHHRSKSLLYRLVHIIILLSIPTSLLLSLSMSLISATNYPGAIALESLHSMSNATNAFVYLDIPTRMTGATLPLSRQGWTYTKSENETILMSVEYWQKIDFALVGSLTDRPCNFGRGITGNGEWEVIHRQRGYAGIQWRKIDFPSIERKLARIGVDGIMERVNIPWIKLEDKIFVLRHLRREELVERSIKFEEDKDKERAGLGERGEVEGQWRDFY